MKKLKKLRTNVREKPSGYSMFSLNLMFDQPDNRECPLDVQKMNRLCTQVLQHQSLLSLEDVSRVELSVQLLDSADMQSLNLQYRQSDSATNVLSFESSMPVLNDENEGAYLMLGDLVFCPQVISAEAQAQAKSIDEHWVHMLVHGTLHLCGYDHIDAAEADDMENLEIDILSTLGLPDPYENRSVS